MEFGSEEAGGAVRTAAAGKRLMRAAFYLIILIAGAFTITACQSLAIYSKTGKYDGQVVRGEVVFVAPPTLMGDVWENTVKQLPDAPSKADFLRDFTRVQVLVEKGLGNAVWSYPYSPLGEVVYVGDIVDIPVYVGGTRLGKFSGRPEIARIVCRASDLPCKGGREGSMRGAVGPVTPRD
jgi:hypothetical protein